MKYAALDHHGKRNGKRSYVTFTYKNYQGYLYSILLFLLLFFNHIDAALTWEDEFIAPSFPTFVISLISLVLLYKRINFNHFTSLLMIAFFIISLSLVLSSIYGNAFNRLLSGLVLTYSFIIGYSLLLLLRNMGKGRVRRTISFFFVFLVIGTLLELFTPFATFSDAVREWFHGWLFVYDASLRDLRDFGAIRPKFFSSEPSKLALTFSTAIVAITALYHKNNIVRSIVLSFFLSFMAIFLCRSAVIIYGFAVSIFIVSMSEFKNFSNRRLVIFISFLVLIFILFLPYLISYFLPYVIGDGTFSSSRSWQRRQIYPAEFTAYFVFSDPMLLLFGAGYGGDDFLTVHMTRYLHLRDIFFRYPDLKGLPSIHLMTNAFYFWLAQMGAFGTFLFMVLLRRFFDKERLAPFSVTLISTCFLWQTFGTISAPMAWVPVFLYAWVISELFSKKPTSRHTGYRKSQTLNRTPRPRFGMIARNG